MNSRLTASNVSSSDELGYSLSVSGYQVAASSIFEDTEGADAGAVFVFHKAGDEWVEETMLTASDGAASDWFGISVAVENDLLVVGAQDSDAIASNAGQAYVFQRQTGGWAEAARYTKSSAAAGDKFGRSVAMDNSRAVFTTPGHSSGTGAIAVADLRSNDTSVQYLHTDHLGSPVAATDSQAAVVDTHSYYPFGEIRSSSTAFDTERGFTGQITDAATGLNFYNARYMDPVLGRFISPDSIVPDPFNPADRNRFVYVRNSPLLHTDPSGHWLNVVGGAIAGAAFGAVIEAGVQLGKSVREDDGLAWSDIDGGRVLRAAGRGALVGATVGSVGAGAAFLGAGPVSTTGALITSAGASGVSATAIDNLAAGNSEPLTTDQVIMTGIIEPIADAVAGPFLVPALEVATHDPAAEDSLSPGMTLDLDSSLPSPSGHRSKFQGSIFTNFSNTTDGWSGMGTNRATTSSTHVRSSSFTPVEVFIPSYIFDGSM